MSVGEVVSALALCASSFDNDELLMVKGIYSIEIGDEFIVLDFIDGNTQCIKIFRDGRTEYLH